MRKLITLLVALCASLGVAGAQAPGPGLFLSPFTPGSIPSLLNYSNGVPVFGVSGLTDTGTGLLYKGAPIVGGGGGYTEEHNYLSGGSYSFTHSLNTQWVLVTCINTNGAPMSQSNYTIASLDANNTAIAVGSAQDLTCSFGSGAILPPYFYSSVPPFAGTYWPSVGGTQTVPFTVTQSIGQGYAGTVTYSTTGLAAGMASSFTPPTITGAGTNTLNLTFPYNQTGATTTFNVVGTDGVKTHAALVPPSITIGDINSGLVEGWDMNEGSGTQFNGLVTGNNCTFAAGAGSWGAVAGFPGSSFTFNGTTQATCANDTATNFTGASDFSVSYWQNMTGAWAFQRVIANYGTTGWLIQNDNGGGVMFFATGTNTQSHQWDVVKTTATGKHHIVIVYQGPWSASHMTAYVDGVSQGTFGPFAGTGSLASATPMYMSASAAFTGNIQKLRIYNRALSQTDVTNYFNAGVK